MARGDDGLSGYVTRGRAEEIERELSDRVAAVERNLERRMDALERDVVGARSDASRAMRLVLDVTRSSLSAALGVYREAIAPPAGAPAAAPAEQEVVDDHA